MPAFRQKRILITSLVWLAAVFFFLYRYGVNTSGEAEKFINDANSIISSGPLSNGVFSLFYLSYSCLLAFFIKFSVSFFVLGLLQIFLSFFAGLLLYRMLLEQTGKDFIAFIAFAVWLFCYPVQKWLLFAYSEAVHTSLLVIGMYYYMKLLRSPNAVNFLAYLLITLFIITTRPVGIIFLLTSFAVLIFFLFARGNKKTGWLLSGLAIITVIVLLNSPFRFFINPDSLKRMEVICQLPQESSHAYTEYNTAGLGVAYDVIKNDIGFGHFFRIGFAKLGSFFGLIRPWFSTKNNIVLGLYLFLYPFAVWGIFSRRKKYPLLIFFCVSYILITAAGIFVTCDEWSGRFVSPVFPFIIICAAMGLDACAERFRKKQVTQPPAFSSASENTIHNT